MLSDSDIQGQSILALALLIDDQNPKQMDYIQCTHNLPYVPLLQYESQTLRLVIFFMYDVELAWGMH